LGTSLLLQGACGYIGFDPPLQPAYDAGGVDGKRDAGSSVNGSGADGGAELDADLPPDEAGMVEASVPASDAASDDAAVASDASQPLDAQGTHDSAIAEAGVDAGRATQVTDYCQQIPELPTDPVIDGRVDADLKVVELTPVGWTAKDGSSMPPAQNTASYALAWRPNGLYVYIRVVDPNRLPAPLGPNIWQGDGVEIYVDDDGTFAHAPKYDNPGTIQLIAAAPSDDVHPVAAAWRWRDGSSDEGQWTSKQFSTFPTANGYVFEGLIQRDALDLTNWTLASGGKVGVDLSINVSALDNQLDAGVPLDGYRLGQYFLRTGQDNGSCAGRPYCSASAFCTPDLIE
jgi:hypothetical protein